MSATIEGYASLFGRIDLTGDRVLPGAFRSALARRGASGIRMLWQHDPAEPIGRWTRLAEDGAGLAVEGELVATTARGREAAALIAAGALDGLSIGFRTVKARRDRAGVREIAEADLWEISLVTFPMLAGARVRLVPAAAPERRLAGAIGRATAAMAG